MDDKQHTKRVKKKRSGEKSIKFRCDYSSTPLKVLESRGWTRIFDTKDRHWDLWWCDTSEIKLALDCNFQRLRAQQRVAHFLNHGELTRKNLLYRNLRRYKRLLLKAGKTREAELCDIMPVSFELPSEYRMLVEEYRRSQGSTWIVKPAAGSQGRGIFLFQRLKDLAEWRSKEYPTPSADSNSDNESMLPTPPDIYVVQKYIDDPYLLGGCKFDMRIYVLVTSFQPLKVWLAREGFARLSGEQYSLERINDSRIHLTNMSIQLKATNAEKQKSINEQQSSPYEQTPQPAVKLGSKWPLSRLREYLTERHGPAVVDDLLHNIAASHIAEKLASTCTEKNCNKENELNGTCDSNERCSEEIESNDTRQAVIKKPVRVLKTLRIGWLNKTAGQSKYRKVQRPRGGVKKLKLDAAVYYSLHQIRRMAIEAFEKTSNKEHCAIEDEYTVNLGDFGGQIISDFSRQDGKLCDIWEYCRDRGKSLYQLNLYMLTSPIDEEVGMMFNGRTISTRRRKAQPKIVNNVRVLYLYVRRSRYSNELSSIECEKSGLHGRMLDDNCGEGPAIEYFHPLDHGYAISRIELSDRVLLQVYFDDDENRSIEFPSESETSLEEHSIIYDLDRLQGYCDWKFGIGFVPSCTDACRPLFSWYKDGVLFKSMESLYWLDNVKDHQPHLWSCIVTCKKTDRQLKSKEILIDGFE